MKVKVLPSVTSGWRGHRMIAVEAALGYAEMRECKRCGETFTPSRKRQAYCSKRCCNAEAQKRAAV